MNKDWDIIIIGAGPAGLTAGIYASRARLKTLILEAGEPVCQLLTTERIENYPGLPDNTGGLELIENMRTQAVNFGAGIINDKVTKVSDDKGDSKLIYTSKKEYRTSAVIIAAGASPKKLNIPGENKLLGKGVSYCAVCDGSFFKDKKVVVVGGGDAAVEEALFLTRFCKEVTLIHRRDRLRAVKILQERVLANEKINISWNSVVKEIAGNDIVEQVVIEDVKTSQIKNIACDGIFISIGFSPNSDFLKDYIDLDKTGYILTDNDMQTSVKGIYACGDVRKKILRQAIVASGEGATAAFAAQRHIEDLTGSAY